MTLDWQGLLKGSEVTIVEMTTSKIMTIQLVDPSVSHSQQMRPNLEGVGCPHAPVGRAKGCPPPTWPSDSNNVRPG